MKRSSLVFLGAALVLSACAGETGPAGAVGAPGDKGNGCTVADNGDSTYTVTCDGDAVTLSNGTPGAACTVTDNGDASYTIDCDGKQVTVSSGEAGASCTVADNGDGTKTVTCGEDEVTIEDGTPGAACTVADNGDGTYKVTCGDAEVTLSDGEAGGACTVADNGDGTYKVTCGEESVTLSNGTAGAPGTSCAVADNGDGTKTITCGEDEVTVSDGTGVTAEELEAIQSKLAELSAVEPESCAVCHKGGGAKHQAVYDDYKDASTLEITIDSVVSVANAAPATDFTTTVKFTITKSFAPYLDDDKLPNLPQWRMYAVTYDTATKTFTNSKSFSKNSVKALGDGKYEVAAADIKYAPETSNALVYAYVASDVLGTEGMKLYGNVHNTGSPFGDVDKYESAATVSGCEKCHGKPYMKHGYRAAEVEGLPDFAACKTCHYDDRNGNHVDWQVLVDDPLRYSELEDKPLTDDEKAKYAYKATVMNDTHMSHAMEFPYPQSMANCATCHEGKLDMILADEQFKLATCKSCHAQVGSEKYGTSEHALQTLWDALPADQAAMHDIDVDNCSGCHKTGGFGPAFSELHTGYDTKIYADAKGTKYAELFVGSVDDATSYDAATHKLTIKFSVTESDESAVAANPADVVPTLMVGLYGYDTKDYIVGPHQKDADGKRLLEYKVDGVTENPRFTTVAAADGSWTVTADLTMWADMIADGTVKRAEIAFMPRLEIDGVVVALDAPSKTFDLTSNAFDNGYYPDIVDIKGCNACHDALATTFHSGDRGGNIKVCRLCHIPASGGSHLEMQSRSIDSYTHAIHSFQAFDSGDVDFTDPVEALRYEHHVEHKFPNFTIKNCQACHVEGAFEVPDQSKSLPGVFSKADAWETDRNIGAVPSFVAGPGSRACGACHRAHSINEDNYGALIAFNQHTKENGYLIETMTGLWDAVVESILSKFE